jgi:hypothetical protein
MLIVRPAKEPDPVDIVPVGARESVYVIELECPSLAAAPTALIRERTAVNTRFNRLNQVQGRFIRLPFIALPRRTCPDLPGPIVLVHRRAGTPPAEER